MGAFENRFKLNNPILNTNSNYTITDVDSLTHVSVSGSGIRTITLPSAANNIGRHISIRKEDTSELVANRVVIARNGSDTIDSQASDHTLYAPNDSITLVSTGSTNWNIVGKVRTPYFKAKSSGTPVQGATDILSWGNLVIGKTYIVKADANVYNHGAAQAPYGIYQCNFYSGAGGTGIAYGSLYTNVTYTANPTTFVDGYQSPFGGTLIFTAVSDTLYMRGSADGGSVRKVYVPYAYVQELPDYKSSTVW